MRDTLRRALLSLAFLTLPATAGLVVLARPIVRLLYERGLFGPDATAGTAAALTFYAAGLVAYTSVKVLAPAFYALGAPRVPLVASALAVATNLLVNLTFYEPYGFRAVALGTSLGSIANAALLLAVLHGKLGPVLGGDSLRRLALMAASAVAMAVVLVPVRDALEGAAGTIGLAAQVVTGLGPVALGVVVYLGLAWLLRLPEASAVLDLVRRAGRPSPPALKE
jgi:putative peptidoglycan lipid II flippase